MRCYPSSVRKDRLANGETGRRGGWTSAGRRQRDGCFSDAEALETDREQSSRLTMFRAIVTICESAAR